MATLIHDDFLLTTDLSRRLYHEYAKDCPIYDYHCHLPPADIAENRQFTDIAEIWLGGDHYKWRAMRANGVDEERITGKAPLRDKFRAFAETLPYALGNPLYHWSHLELARFFGITDLLDGTNADDIYDRANQVMKDQPFTAHRLVADSRVKVICTTDDPADSLEYHQSLAGKDLPFSVFPTFRPDKAANAHDPEAFATYAAALGTSAGITIDGWSSLQEALKRRHAFFHELGCRLSDHALVLPVYLPASDAELEAIVRGLLQRQAASPTDQEKLTTAVLSLTGRLNAQAGWTMQLHMGALRNNNSRMYARLGPDTGYDSIVDGPVAVKLSRFLDFLDRDGALPKTILYNLNGRDNDLLATMIGNFQGGVPGKMQLGSGWWFMDQRTGMEAQMKSLANQGLLRRFVGMLTDSRSFLSYTRHEYFRRILCELLGTWVARGELPGDEALLGETVRDISYRNAQNYFGFPTKG